MFKKYKPYKTLLIIGDALLIVLSLYIIGELRPLLPGKSIMAESVAPKPLLYPLTVILWHVHFAVTGVYDLRKIPSFSSQWIALTIAYILGVMIFGGLLYFTFRDVSRMLALYFCGFSYLALTMERAVVVGLLRKFRNAGKPAKVLIIGATDSGIRIALTMLERHRSVYNIVGFVDNDPSEYGLLPSSFLGKIEDVPRLVQKKEIEIVVVALPDARTAEVEDLVISLDALPVRVYLAPDMLNLAMIHAEVENFGDLIVVGVREPMIQGPRRVAKRILDLVVSSICLLVFWPVMLIIWVAIKIDSPGPALYKPERVGENGRKFTMLKFRTMYVDADKRVQQVKQKDEYGREVEIYKTDDDPRVTRVGRFLRKTSLDELPQLFNVFKGEMSLVGPRPEQPFITEKYEHWQWQRLAVPPGVTGWWQVSGRSDLPLHLNTQYDLYYVRNYSLSLDLKILLKTIVVVLKGKGAY
jgi:exopolysaccharide biosynthesis polyprenyl glycosylphosphotransferase